MARGAPGDVELNKAITTFNSQQDALIAIVKHRCPELKGETGDLHIQLFDPQGGYVHLAHYPPPDEKQTEIKIAFDPPITAPHQARLRMLDWKDQAFKAYRVPQVPRIYYYKHLPMFPFGIPVLAALGLLFFTVWGSGSIADWLRAKVESFGGPHFLKVALYFAAAMHLVIEPAFMVWLTQKHGTPLKPRLQWIFWNMVFGFGVMDAFFESVIYERKRVVYRGTDVGDIGPNVAGQENPFLKQAAAKAQAETKKDK